MPHPLHVLVNDFALRSLRETADKDYVHGRLAFRAKLTPQFLWSSLHCLEKYAKCVLLLNRINGRDIKHEVTPSLERIAAHGRFSIPLSKEVTDFVAKLEGGARFRYYEMSYSGDELELSTLDRAVWEIRRYCQPLDYETSVNGKSESQLQANLARVAAGIAGEQMGSCIADGWLERVIENSNHAARGALIWKNLFFGGRRRVKIVMRKYFEAGNAPLQLHPEIADEVTKYIFLPSEIRENYKLLAAKRRKSKEKVSDA